MKIEISPYPLSRFGKVVYAVAYLPMAILVAVAIAAPHLNDVAFSMCVGAQLAIVASLLALRADNAEAREKTNED